MAEMAYFGLVSPDRMESQICKMAFQSGSNSKLDVARSKSRSKDDVERNMTSNYTIISSRISVCLKKLDFDGSQFLTECNDRSVSVDAKLKKNI